MAQEIAAPVPPTAAATGSEISARETGLFADATFNILLRNFTEFLEISDGADRHAWVQGAQFRFQSGFTPGAVGLGFDVAPFAALKLDGGQGARNMVYVPRNPGDANRTAWAYIGEYAVKVRLPGVLVKYGLQSIANPFLDPYDIRALPPSFRGVSVRATPFDGVTLYGGSIDAVIERGASYLKPLSTTYGGVAFSRLSYVGADWAYAPGGKASVYANRAADVWHQYYGSLAQSIGEPGGIKWTGGADIYITRAQGARLQGPIDNKGYSLSVTGAQGASSLMLGYQRILGEEYFDFLRETSGIYLSNAMGVDFNGPGERSVQLRYKFNGDAAGMKGVQFMAWAISGWGVDGRAGAARYAAPNSLLHDAYWKNGRPIEGGHQEVGIKPTYTLQDGRLKGTKISLILIAHKITPLYPSKSFRDARLLIDVPINIF